MLDISCKLQIKVYIKRVNKDDNIIKLYNFHTLQNWHSVYYGRNVNESYNNFLGIFLDIHNHCCPLNQCIIKENSKTSITNSLRNAC